MIPKIIHYVWLGKGKKPDLFYKCLNSWKKYCPDYLIKEWNEDVFDITSNRYVDEAYNCKKYAFASDYIRLYALYTEGGIYVDTDLELLGPIDSFLDDNAFSGYEKPFSIPTAIMGAEKENKWIKLLLDYYKDRSFYNNDGSMDLTTNVITISKLTKEKYGCEYNNELIEIPGVFKIYPRDYFCPKDIISGELEYLSENTVAIHHFNGSWIRKYEVKIKKIRYEYVKKYGNEIGLEKYNDWFNKYKLYHHIRLYGIKAVLNNVLNNYIFKGRRQS